MERLKTEGKEREREKHTFSFTSHSETEKDFRAVKIESERHKLLFFPTSLPPGSSERDGDSDSNQVVEEEGGQTHE